MRVRLLAGAVLGAGLALAVLPAAPASAVCMNVPVEGLGCVNPCYPVYASYDRADGVVKDALPDGLFHCLH